MSIKMKQKIIKKIKKLIDEHYLTDWEFIVNVIAPEFEEEEIDIYEVAAMIYITNSERTLNLRDNK